MREFHLTIATPDGVEFDGLVESLLVKTGDGDVEILAGHTDLLATLAVGRARVLTAGKSRFASVAGGFISVTKDEVALVCTTFEFADSIDVKRAEKAKEHAEELLRQAKSDKQMRAAEAKLSRALNRLKVSKL